MGFRGHIVLLVPAALAIFGCASTRGGAPSRAPTSVASTPPAPKAGAVALELHQASASTLQGDEIAVTLHIRNSRRARISFCGTQPFVEDLKLVVRGPDGQVRPNPEDGPQDDCVDEIVEPNAALTLPTALNRWARFDRPGRYEVVARYQGEAGSGVSAPLVVVVQPRDPEKLGALIAELGRRLEASGDTAATDTWVQRLAWTNDVRAAPYLIGSSYRRRRAFAEMRALLYLPSHASIKHLLVAQALERGLAPDMDWGLPLLGAERNDMLPIIERSLAADNPRSWPNGALAAQIYGDDRFTPRLVALAVDPSSGAEQQAIYALALNRTDESVRTLRALLDGPARSLVEDAVRTAYASRGVAQGRPLRPDDFDASLQGPAQKQSP